MLIVNHTQQKDDSDIISSEQKLVTAAQQNDESFKKLYHLHYNTVFSFVLNRVNDKQTTVGIVQQVFSNALAGIKKHKSDSMLFSVYLKKIALSECNNFFKSKNRKRCIVVDEKMSKNLIEHIGVINSTGTSIENLENALQLLSAEEVQLLELRYFEKRTFQEGGHLLGLSENTIKLKTYSLLNKIKRLMKDGIRGVKSYHNIEILNRYSLVSIEEVKSSMNFEALWKNYENNKLSAGQVLRRAFMSIGFA